MWHLLLLYQIAIISAASLKFEHIKQLQEKDVAGRSRAIVFFTNSSSDSKNLKALDEAAAKLQSTKVACRYVLVESSIPSTLNSPEIERVKSLFVDVDELPFLDYVITTVLPANLTANFTFGKRVEHLNATEIPDTYVKVNAIAEKAFEQYAKIPDIEKLAVAEKLREEDLAPIYAQFFKITSEAIEKLAELSAQLTKQSNEGSKSNKKEKRGIRSRFCARMERIGELCA
uniref:Ovule protein n=1 Tax=Parascaris univalens TaxID=6257 RepID=A0A915A9X6_PARUN